MERTDFLFAQPSFVTGVARVVDLGGTLGGHSYNESQSPAEADSRAFASDWAVICRDMREVIDSFEHGEQEAE